MSNENRQLTTKWKDIPGMEGCYMASDDGQIRSTDRMVNRSTGGQQVSKGRVLKQYRNKSGYNTVALSINGSPKTQYVHRLIAITFLGKSDGVVDHLNHNKSDNRLVNLRYCTQRENLMNISNKSKSGYTGVYINPPSYKRRYRARIKVNGKLVELGSYNTGFEAHRAYLKYKLSNKL